MTDKESFLITEIPTLLNGLNEDTKPQWGIMTAQHMIEHVTGSWLISNGRFTTKELSIPQEKLKARREFLFSDKPYAKNITNPVQGDGLQKLRKASLQEAKDSLLQNISAFFEYHDANPDAIFLHPVFGDLDRDGWVTFQVKHIKHHFEQFGLI